MEEQNLPHRLLIYPKRLPDRLQRHPEPPHAHDFRPDALVGERLMRKHRELQRDLRYGSNWLQSGPPNLLLGRGMPMTTPKQAFILAGPNGAGKTTFAREFLVHEASCPAFINADLIAAGLSPFAPERASLRAGRLMLELIDDAVRRGESFAIETTLAGRNYLRAIPEWRARGFFVTLVFVMLPTPEQAIARVAERVRQGGHFIPDATVVRRFSLGLKNLPEYQEIVDAWLTYDGSGLSPKAIAKWRSS